MSIKVEEEPAGTVETWVEPSPNLKTVFELKLITPFVKVRGFVLSESWTVEPVFKATLVPTVLFIVISSAEVAGHSTPTVWSAAPL